jgi:very-short-patch-repair endonuclease
MVRERKLETSRKPIWGKLKETGRSLRREQTNAEAILWECLRKARQGVKFRRQHTIDRFIVDFFCFPARLVVEIDGPVHEGHQQEDAVREAHLRRLGYEVLRFSNDDVYIATGSSIGQHSRGH